MEFAEWEPIYEAILDDLGYDRAGDERARDLLCEMTQLFDLDRLSFAGETVAVVAPAVIGEREISRADRVVAISSAAHRLNATGRAIDLVVTDLDGTPETAVRLTHEGTPVAVAAHGDNIPALREYVPKMAADNVLGTTQAEPRAPLLNAGGFTDGDRAAYIADRCDADELHFPGWDLDDPSVTSMKERKLVWADRLLRLLEQRRGDRFELLDGRREAIDREMKQLSLEMR